MTKYLMIMFGRKKGCDCKHRFGIGATIGGTQLEACKKCGKVYVKQRELRSYA